MTLLLTHQFTPYVHAKMVGIMDKVYYKAKGICILHELSQGAWSYNAKGWRQAGSKSEGMKGTSAELLLSLMINSNTPKISVNITILRCVTHYIMVSWDLVM